MTEQNEGSELAHLSAGLDRAKSLFDHMSHEVGFILPRELHLSFNQLIFLNLNRQKEHLQRLSEKNARTDWFLKFSSSVHEVREGLTACFYHLGEVERLETKLIELVKRYLKFIELSPGQTIAGGHFERLNFEYHAYAFAVQRTLAYFAKSIGCFYKKEISSVRKIQKSIADQKPLDVTMSIVARFDKIAAVKPEVFGSKEKKKSLRDILAHDKNVQAGTLNIARTGDGRYNVALAGGMEELHLSPMQFFELSDAGSPPNLSLTPVLRRDLDSIVSLVMGAYWDMGLLYAPLLNGISANKRFEAI